MQNNEFVNPGFTFLINLKLNPATHFNKVLALVIVLASTMSFRNAFSRNLCSE